MRSRLPAWLPLLAAACSSYPAGQGAAAGPDSLPAPTCALGDVPAPVEVHALLDGPTVVRPVFGACGHLLNRDRLAAPDLAVLGEGWGDPDSSSAFFSPTGEWLSVERWADLEPRTEVHDLRSGAVHEFPGFVKSAAAPRRDGAGSFHVRCGPGELLSTFDGERSEVAVDFVDCGHPWSVAGAAPVVVFFRGGDYVLSVIDLEDGSVRALPFEDNPPSHHGDLVHPSRDGRLLVYQRVGVVFHDDGSDLVPEDRVYLVDLQRGQILATLPAEGGAGAPVVEPVDLPGRGHGLLWSTGGQTFVVAPDSSVDVYPFELDRLAWAGPEAVIGRQEGTGDPGAWVRLDLAFASWTSLPSALANPVVSPSGRGLAATSSLAGEAGRGSSQIEFEGLDPWVVDGRVQWLGDDGTVLVIDGTRTLDGYRLVLRDPGGAERAFAFLPFSGFDAPGPAVVRAGGASLAALAEGRLVVFDLAAGTSRVLADGVRRFSLDPAGRRIAFGVESSPDDHVVEEVLHAGRLGP